jgi:hypothetical protein
MAGSSFRTWAPISSVAPFAVTLAMSLPADARVVRIVIDDVQPLVTAAGQTLAYEQIAGRAFGELDARDPVNAIIQDIELGKSSDGKVHYVATFVLTKPVELSNASGLMWHDVPNRGSPLVINVAERNFGDLGMAGRQLGRHCSAQHDAGRRPPLAAGPDRAPSRRLDDHRRRARTHRQPRRH